MALLRHIPHRLLKVLNWSSIVSGFENPGGLFEYVFAGYVPLVSHNLYLIMVNSVANYTPRICQYWVNVIFAIPS